MEVIERIKHRIAKIQRIRYRLRQKMMPFLITGGKAKDNSTSYKSM